LLVIFVRSPKELQVLKSEILVEHHSNALKPPKLLWLAQSLQKASLYQLSSEIRKKYMPDDVFV